MLHYAVLWKVLKGGVDTVYAVHYTDRFLKGGDLVSAHFKTLQRVSACVSCTYYTSLMTCSGWLMLLALCLSHSSYLPGFGMSINELKSGMYKSAHTDIYICKWPKCKHVTFGNCLIWQNMRWKAEQKSTNSPKILWHHQYWWFSLFTSYSAKWLHIFERVPVRCAQSPRATRGRCKILWASLVCDTCVDILLECVMQCNAKSKLRIKMASTGNYLFAWLVRGSSTDLYHGPDIKVFRPFKSM